MSPSKGLIGLDSSLPFSADPLRHVFLVIPGAGDPYVHYQPWLSSLEICLTRLQSNYNLALSDLQKLSREGPPHSQAYDALFLPVEWHRAALETWQREVRCADPRPTARDTPTVRDAVSETMGDIIMIGSPFWRRTLSDHIASQIQLQLSAVRRNRPAFTGSVSIMAHSVGCNLALELLHRQLLPFQIDAVVLVGCPIPAYAALAPDDQPILSTVRNLRSKVRFINVFHPLDPVAYRLEPFVMPKGSTIPPAVKVAPRRRSFWKDAEAFWDDVVYNLWSTLFPRKVNVRGNSEGRAEDEEDDEEDEEDEEDQESRALPNLFTSFGGNTRGKARVKDAKEREKKRQELRRPTSQRSAVSEQAPVDGDQISNHVLLSGRIDYELQDGMGMPPLDVMASWGAIKAHTYYWQSFDIAQMLLDIVITSDDAMASRKE